MPSILPAPASKSLLPISVHIGAEMTGTKKRFHLIFFPTPGVGHLIPMVEVARRLVRREPQLVATVLLITSQPHSNNNGTAGVTTSYIDYVAATEPEISFHRLPPTEPPPPEQHGGEGEAYLSLLVECNKANVREVVAGYKSDSTEKPAALAVVVDLFATGIIDVARELRVPAYVYFASSAVMLGLMMYLPTIETIPELVRQQQSLVGGQHEVSATIDFPGFKAPLPMACLPSAYRNGEGTGYEWLLRHGRKFPQARGIVVNTFPGLETGALDALTGGRYLPDGCLTPRVYPIGKQPISSWGCCYQNDPCIPWLDQQPDTSVVYLCFGSLGGLSEPQAAEITAGLERARCRFLWALSGRDASALSEEFEERTADRGMLVRGWAPQAEVLAHRAVAGFVAHCGWNSCLEALYHGVPILAWPIQAEQHLNAFEMAEELGVAVGVMGDGAEGRAAGVVSREEVEKGLNTLMDSVSERGRRTRENVRKMKDVCSRALQRDGEVGTMNTVDLVEALLLEDMLSSGSSLLDSTSDPTAALYPFDEMLE